MVVAYAQGDSLPHAVAKTFDGKHPCDLCKQISKSKKSEELPVTLKSDKKIESLPGAAIFIFLGGDAAFRWTTRDVLLGAGRADSPPVPPPRFFLS